MFNIFYDTEHLISSSGRNKEDGYEFAKVDGENFSCKIVLAFLNDLGIY